MPLAQRCSCCASISQLAPPPGSRNARRRRLPPRIACLAKRLLAADARLDRRIERLAHGGNRVYGESSSVSFTIVEVGALDLLVDDDAPRLSISLILDTHSRSANTASWAVLARTAAGRAAAPTARASAAVVGLPLTRRAQPRAGAYGHPRTRPSFRSVSCEFSACFVPRLIAAPARWLRELVALIWPLRSRKRSCSLGRA